MRFRRWQYHQPGDCELDVVVAGGYSWKSAAAKGSLLGCGSTGSNGTSIGVEVYGPGEDGDYHDVVVMFQPPLAASQVGDVPVAVGVVATDDVTVRAE